MEHGSFIDDLSRGKKTVIFHSYVSSRWFTEGITPILRHTSWPAGSAFSILRASWTHPLASRVRMLRNLPGIEQIGGKHLRRTGFF
jgi:hypothetical protein